MGLMLSVLVFCVGVVEVLDCWHHFMLHLVQPQYNPLPYHLDRKRDVLHERDLNTPAESRRTSYVNIRWPRDLSPTDDLHVIKKRSHGDTERKHDHDKDSMGHHSALNALHSEKEAGHSARVDAQGSDSDLSSFNTPEPGETSLSHVELGVIVESDTSSEEDEPSLVENESRKVVENQKKRSATTDESNESLREQSMDIDYDRRDIKTNTAAEECDDWLKRPTTPNPSRSESLCDNEVRKEKPGYTFASEECDERVKRPTTPNPSRSESLCDTEVRKEEPGNKSDQKLPIFTDNILSEAVKVISYHATGADDNLVNTSNLKYDSKENDECPIDIDTLVSDHQNDSSTKATTNLLSSKEKVSTSQPIEEVPTGGPEAVPEFPQIMLHESSPTPLEDSSDSSLNTSDASWMVRSRTSDRPLKIRLSQSPEDVAEDFISVTKTDLQAFACTDTPIHQSEEVCSQDASSIHQQQPILPTKKEANQIHENSVLSTVENMVQPFEISNERVNEEVLAEPTTSSSSSLSGIPQLPEDLRDNTQCTPLPADNGYGKSSLRKQVHPIEVSASTSDGLVISPVSSDNVERVAEETSRPAEAEDLDSHASSGKSVNNDQGVEVGQCKSKELQVSLPKETTQKKDVQDQCVPQTHEESNAKSNHSSVAAPADDSPSKVAEQKEGKVKTQKNVTSLSTEPKPVGKSIESSTLHKDSDVTEEVLILDSLVPDVHSIPSLPVNQSLISPVANESKTNESSHDKEETSQEPDPEDSEVKPKSLQRRDTKRKSKMKPRSFQKRPATPNEDPVLVCKAVESDEEDHAENRAKSVCVRSKTPISDLKNDESLETLDKPNLPSPPELEGSSSAASAAPASNPPNEENKANWLIFSGEYTKAMNKDWHSGHFCCWQCDESLTGQRYVLRDEHPYCIKCYESVFANSCEECSKIIGIDSKDLSYKDKHWHEACFLCNKCRVSLVDKQFGSKLDKIFCGPCYDAQFASRCDGCGQIFKAGTKKMEYKTRQWHEPCFSCCVCKTPIGTKSFIPREQEIYCATCYEEKFATRCVKCNKIITSGGVTYKNEPWHRECFTCTNCSTSLAGQRFTSRDEKPYCADCFGELFAKRCTACCKPITGIGGTRFISFEDRHWHNDCFICASCKTSLVGRGFITDAEDIICPECAKQKLM